MLGRGPTGVRQGISTSALLILWEVYVFVVGRCSIYYRIWGSLQDLYPIDASNSKPFLPNCDNQKYLQAFQNVT